MNILISGVGGPTPRSIARSILRLSKFKDAKLYGTDINRTAYGLYENDLYTKTFIIPRASSPNYWTEIKNIVEEYNIDLAMVHPELEVLEWTRFKKEGGEWPCKVLLPTHELVEILVDKARMTEVLKDFDGFVPPSVQIDPKGIDFDAIEKTLGYPFWIRSTSGSSGLGSLKVEDAESLKTWIHINPGVTEFIASKFLPGRNLACKLLYHKGELVRSASGERVNYIMAKVAPSGITGNTSFGRLLNEPELVDKATKAMDILFKETNAPKHGFFTADFKEDEKGEPYITEINVRMVAFNYSFAKGGANFSNDIVQLLSNDETFDKSYKMYEFEPDTVFLRDVDGEPKLMKKKNLL